MKSKLLLLLFCFTAFSTIAKPVIIKGKINGKHPKDLYYTAPVNGSLGFNLYYTAKVDAKGNFEIKADLTETTFIDIYYNYQPAGALIVAPGSSYSIVINEADGKVNHVIKGPNAEAQKWYTGVINDHRESVFINLGMKLAKLETPSAITEETKTLESTDVAAITKLYESKAISKQLYTILLTERSYLYAASVGYAILVKHIYAERDPANPDMSEFDSLWKTNYTSHSPADPLVSKSPWGTYFLDGYKNYKLYESIGFDGKLINQLGELEIMKRNKTFLTEPNAEYYSAVNLFFSTFGDKKDKIVLSQLAYFKEQYPKSGYTKYLQPRIDVVADFYKNNANLPEGATYVEDYANINTFDDLLKKFPGKKLYFDVWATWCSPCRAEFKYKDELYKLLKANNIEVVYISLDRDDKEETWKKMISHYGLVGYHVRASRALDEDLNEKLNLKGIPRYILTNNGNITAQYAPPPSEMDKLEKEISKL